MSKNLLASKVVIFEEEPKVRGIPSGPTAVTGAVGVTETGPFNTAVLCTSFDEYQATFGGFTTSSNVALAAKGFFENGGSQLWVSRVSSSSAVAASGQLIVAGDGEDPRPASTTSGVGAPYTLFDGDELDIEVGEDTISVTFECQPANITSASQESFALSDGQTLLVAVDGAAPRTVVFSTSQFDDITQATAQEVADVITAALTVDLPYATAASGEGAVVITTTSAGNASTLEVTGGTAAVTFGLFGVSGAGTGNIGNFTAVTIAEIASLVDDAGGDGIVQVTGTAVITFSTVATGADASIEVSGVGGGRLVIDPVICYGSDGGLTRAITRGTVDPPFTFSPLPAGLIVVDFDESGSPIVTNLSIEGTPAEVKSASGFVNPYELADGQTLLVSVNNGDPQTVVFSSEQFDDITAASGGEVRAAILAAIPDIDVSPGFFDDDKVVMRTVDSGTAMSIAVAGGSAAATLGLTDASGVGTGTVPNTNAVTIADLAAMVPEGSAFEIVDHDGQIQFQSTAVGASAYVGLGGPAIDAMGFNNLGHYGTGRVGGPVLQVDALTPGLVGNLTSLRVDPPTDGNSGELNLLVFQDGTLVETFESLSRNVGDGRFVETIVNDAGTGSRYVRVTNLDGLTGLPPDLDQTLALSGGDDGFGALADSDYIGNSASKTGVYAFDTVQDLALLIVPGAATPGVHNGMLTYCEQYRDGTVFAVLDPPAAISAADMVTYVTDTAALEGSSEYGAIFWPRVKVMNPNKTVFGADDLIVVPPSGIIAGAYGRTDAARPGGVYEPSAGIDTGRLFGVLGFDNDDTLKERKRDLVYPHRINPLTNESDLPFYIDGSRTLKADGNFAFIAERRGVQFIERSLQKGLAFARHKRNTPELRAQLRRTIVAFLTTQMNNGAFRSNDPAKAFFVDVSDQLNPPSVVAAGKLIVRIGLATNKPAEFIILEISQDTRALSAELFGS